ncbi:MAG: hypothetical protein AAGD25_10125 [Cyanobacteria bacterium P01_F01_bin.150]
MNTSSPHPVIPHMPHVLNYGMGVDSTAILLKWLAMSDEERGFPLCDLIVLTAQTGDEFESTKELVETHIFSLLRKHHIRFVEVAKHGPRQKDGYTVLQDTREPYRLNIDGDFKLSTHMHERGTIPALSGPHLCAMKWKGYVIDRWLEDHLHCQVFGPYLGYSAEETKRAEKCEEYQCRGNAFRFPLIEWNMTRLDCIAYIQEQLGVLWKKSCCKYCPYQSVATAMERYKEEPDAAAFALFTEMLSLALNPRMHLFSSGTAYDLIVQSSNQRALEAFERLLSEQEWGLYRVERIYERKVSQKSGKPFTSVARRVSTVDVGTKPEMTEQLYVLAEEYGGGVEEAYGAARTYTHHRENGVYPAVEGFWVVCPALVQDKVRNARVFQQKWDEFTGAVKQLSLV